MSSASRGLVPREGLECLLVKMGCTGPLAEPCRGPQAGKSGDPCFENADRSILSNEYLAYGSVIEGVPNSLLWVSYEGTFLRFGFELYQVEAFSHKHRNPKL